MLALIGLGVLAAAAWRIGALRVSPIWRIGLPALAAAVGLLAMGWWLRRRWVPARASAAYLDQTFGLQQRLVTAAEFAEAGSAKPLYPVLVEDTVERLSGQSLRLPKPLDRTTIALAILLLLLLVWPLGGSSPLQQLAQLSRPTPPDSPLAEPGTPPPATGGGVGDSHPEAGGRGTPQSQSSQQPQTGDSGGADQAPSGGTEGQQQDESSSGGSQPDSRQHGQEGQQGGQQSAGEQGSEASREPGRQADAGQAPGQQTQGQQQTQRQQQAPPNRAGQADGQQGKTDAQSPGRQQGDRAGSGTAGQRQAGSAGQSGQSEALKAEIQQLLKEVSGELQELQAQVAQASSQHQPAAGTGTDPQLFESPTVLDPAKGETLPIQLSTDEAPTASPRPGAGVGRPSDKASSASPQAVPEDAQLSETPTEEDAAARQVVPPEYRSVFDRLQQRPAPAREPQ